MAKPHRMLNDALGAAVQTGVPLIVRRRCSPHEQAAWTAIRFLMETTDRTAFGLREIADEMPTKSYPRVSGWIAALVAAGVLEIIGHETLPNLTESRPIYRIPWKAVLDASILEAEKCVAGTTKKRLGRIASGRGIEQLQIEFSVTNGSQEPCDRSITGPVTNGSQEPVTNGSQGLLPIDHRKSPFPVIDRSHGGGWRMEEEEDLRAHARGSPPGEGDRPAIVTPPTHWTLPQHPLDLWPTVCLSPRPSDLTHLAALAAEHDAATGGQGYGWYWLGRAILAASLTESIGSIAKVRSVLNRWRNGDCYGSDISYGRKRASDMGGRRADDRAPGDAPPARAAAPAPARKPRPGERGYLRGPAE